MYDTYYSLLCLEYSDENYLKSSNTKILKHNLKIIDNSILISENIDMFDNISNIYYYVELCRKLEITISKMKREILIEYLDKVKISEGCYAFSVKHKEEINGNHKSSKEVFLSTYLSLSILKDLGVSTKNLDDTKDWVERNFELLNREQIVADNLSTVLLLYKTAQMLNIENMEHFNLLKSYYKNISTNILEEYRQCDTLDIFLFYDLFQASIEIRGLDTFLIKYAEIDEYLLSLQQEDGCFSVTRADESNIMPTYFILSYFSKKNIKMKDNTFTAIANAQTVEGFFVPMMQRESDIIATYYAYQISKLEHNSSVFFMNKSIEKYINEYDYRNILEDEESLLCYIRLQEEIGNDNFILPKYNFGL